MEISTTLSLAQIASNLAPAFAAGFAVQQCLQVVDAVASWDQMKPDKKKGIMGLISLVLGALLAVSGLRVLIAIAPNHPISAPIDILVSALVISAGTEGFNSIMKFLSYQKESAKADAAVKKAAAANTPQPDKVGAPAMVNGSRSELDRGAVPLREQMQLLQLPYGVLLGD
jgi:hypothetical protein